MGNIAVRASRQELTAVSGPLICQTHGGLVRSEPWSRDVPGKPLDYGVVSGGKMHQGLTKA